MEAAEAFKLIKQQTRIPIVADIHFDYRIALKVAEYGADCLRINPGNIGNEERVRAVVAPVTTTSPSASASTAVPGA
jgi:(E)-4-hydroxy-3-methylbut-2-enyl-diphosphate synthase